MWFPAEQCSKPSHGGYLLANIEQTLRSWIANPFIWQMTLCVCWWMVTTGKWHDIMGTSMVTAEEDYTVLHQKSLTWSDVMDQRDK